MKHITHIGQFDRKFVDDLFAKADQMVRTDFYDTYTKNYVLGSLFFEPSTRTKLSFESAHSRLGGSVISESGNSSLLKGETLVDTIKTVSQLADVICLRYSGDLTAVELAEHSSVPFINCGDGANEHPTQALLDLYTIYKSLGRMDNFSVLFFGDMRYARTIKSLRQLLLLCENVKVEFELPYYSASEPGDRGWTEKLKDCDVLYITRPQKERWPKPDAFTMKNTAVSFNEVRMMKEGSIVLHPGPRTKEMNPAVDVDPKIKMWDQVKLGMILRMALLKTVLKD